MGRKDTLEDKSKQMEGLTSLFYSVFENQLSQGG